MKPEPLPLAVIAVLDLGISLLIASLLFAMIFKVLPDVRLQWHDTWQGGRIVSEATAVLTRMEFLVEASAQDRLRTSGSHGHRQADGFLAAR